MLSICLALATCAGLAAPPAAGADDSSPTLFAIDRVADIRVRMAPKDFERLRRQTRGPGAGYATETFGPAPDSPFTWFSATVTIDGERFAGAGVRKKGFLGSLDRRRPSLRVDLGRTNKKVRLQGLRKLVLNNGKEGPALVRQCLAYRVFAAAGYPASRCGFAHLRVNGADLGAYVLLEPIDKRFLKHRLRGSKVALWEGTGSDFRPRWVDTFEAKNKRARAKAGALTELTEALAAPDAELLQGLEPLLDVDAFLTFWALEVLVGHEDGYTSFANNFFVYRDRADGKFRFLPWGMDKVMAYPGRVGSREPVSIYTKSSLPHRLAKIPAIRRRYRARLLSIIERVWRPEDLLAEVDTMEAVVTKAMLPSQRKGYRSLRSNLRDFLRRRGEVIRSVLNRSKPERVRGLLPPPKWRVRAKGGKPLQRQGPR